MDERPVREDTFDFLIHGSWQRRGSPNAHLAMKRLFAGHENRIGFDVKKVGYHRLVDFDATVVNGEDDWRQGEHVGSYTNPRSMAWCMLGGLPEEEYQIWKAKEFLTEEAKQRAFWNIPGVDDFTPEQKNELFRDLSHYLTVYPNVTWIGGHHSRKTGASGWPYGKLMANCPWWDIELWTKSNGLWEILQERIRQRDS